MGSKRERNAVVEPTYTSDEMYEIMLEFATFVTTTFDLKGKRLGMPMILPPEALMTMWQSEMEQAVSNDVTMG